MDISMKKVSLLSYDQEKTEEERSSKKKKPVPGFVTWLTRRNSIQAYMCITLNVANMLQFAGALIIFGGVVWVSYFTWAVVIGVPMITAELALGHYINNEIKYVWAMCLVGKGIFWNCLFATIAAATICHIYLTILLHLFIQSNELKIQIIDEAYVKKCMNKSLIVINSESSGSNCRIEGTYFPLTEYLSFDYKYLYIPNSQLWVPTLYLAGICFLMILINCKGIRSLEKVTVLFVLVPYLCAVILAILIFTLPGSMEYLRQCWHLDWYKLRDFSVWAISFKTMIRGFSIGSLSLIFVSVHSDYQDDIMVDVVIVFLNTFLNNVLYTITLLGLVGVTDITLSMPYVDGGFQDYISILLKIIRGIPGLPPPNRLWKFLFYSFLIGSVIAQQAMMVAAVADVIVSLVPKFKTNRFYITTCVCIGFFLLGICIFAMEILKTPTLDSSFVTNGFLQSVTIFWIYNYERVCADFHFLMGYRPSLFYQFTWVISPIVFFGVMITEIFLQPFSDFLSHNSMYLTTLHVIIYMVCAIIQAIFLWRKGERCNIFKPDKSWGPTDPLLKESRIIFKSRIITKELMYRQKLYEEQLVKPADITDQNIVQIM